MLPDSPLITLQCRKSWRNVFPKKIVKCKDMLLRDILRTKINLRVWKTCTFIPISLLVSILLRRSSGPDWMRINIMILSLVMLNGWNYRSFCRKRKVFSGSTLSSTLKILSKKYALKLRIAKFEWYFVTFYLQHLSTSDSQLYQYIQAILFLSWRFLSKN